MKNDMTQFFGGTVLLIVVALGTIACGSFRTFQVESALPARQIIVDGKADDWAGQLFVVGGQKVSLGILNDRDYLYVCVRTDDGAMRRQILRSGLVVWFDPQGGKRKALGIKYPVGMRPEESRMWKGDEGEENEFPAEFEGNLTDLEIYRQGKSTGERLDIDNAEGIEIKAASAGKHFVYELKIPLALSGRDSLGLGAQSGGTIGIGFETAKFDLNSLPRRPGGAIGGTGGLPPTGAYGGFGGRAGMGGRPGRMRPYEPELPENLKIWATVKLGSGGTPKPAGIQSLTK
jgi:hypothetical protein